MHLHRWWLRQFAILSMPPQSLVRLHYRTTILFSLGCGGPKPYDESCVDGLFIDLATLRFVIEASSARKA